MWWDTNMVARTHRRQRYCQRETHLDMVAIIGKEISRELGLNSEKIGWSGTGSSTVRMRMLFLVSRAYYRFTPISWPAILKNLVFLLVCASYFTILAINKWSTVVASQQCQPRKWIVLQRCFGTLWRIRFFKPSAVIFASRCSYVSSRNESQIIFGDSS